MIYNKEKCNLLKRVQKCSFILLDLSLYLDTHPMCQNALAAYSKHQKEFMILNEEYERKYGALTHGILEGENSWKWIEGPWPWDPEMNESEGV